MSTQNTPLLNNETHRNLQYCQLSDAPENDRVASYAITPPIGPYELPPPYSPSPRGVPMITCEICGFLMDITGTMDQHVIKCNNCNEATPIKNPPPGKKYVRCQCNCLLICKSNSQRIACSRNDCRRIINLIPVQPTYSSLPDSCQVSCAYCHNSFMFKTLALLDSCPHCRKMSSIAKKYSVRLGIKCIIAAFIFLILNIGCIVLTYSFTTEYIGVFIIYLAFLLVSVSLFCKSAYYFTMKTSSIDMI